MSVLNLDPFVRARRKELASGIVEERDRFLVRLGYRDDRVRWTGPDGVVNEQQAKVSLFDYTPIVLGRL